MTEEKNEQPQLIVLKDRVFRPAQITVGPDFTKTIDDTIAAESLQMVSSAYLGERRYMATENAPITRHSGFEVDDSRAAEAEMRQRAVNHAARLAEQFGVPYFSVSFTVTEVKPPIDLVHSMSNYLFNFAATEVKEKYNKFSRDYEVKPRKVEYALHPTAQFYIRKGETQ